jgi:transcriptional regulator with XRE-family HTH domain
MIGEEVRRRRETLGLSGAQLAQRAGLAPSAVSQIETGKRTPSSASVIKLAAALGVEVGDLYPKGQAPLPDMQEYVDVLIERGFPAKQIAAWLAQDERDEEFIARELEKMSRKDLLEQIMAISPALRKYYRENPPRTDSPARSESA